MSEEAEVPDEPLDTLVDEIDHEVRQETRATSRENLRVYLNEIRRIALLSREEEVELARRTRAGDVAAKSRLTEANLRLVVQIARRNGVSVFPVYVSGYERSMFENLARQTGGAPFSLRELRKLSEKVIGERIFDVLRHHYVLQVGGNLALGEKIQVQVNRPAKLFVSALPQE